MLLQLVIFDRDTNKIIDMSSIEEQNPPLIRSSTFQDNTVYSIDWTPVGAAEDSRMSGLSADFMVLRAELIPYPKEEDKVFTEDITVIKWKEEQENSSYNSEEFSSMLQETDEEPEGYEPVDEEADELDYLPDNLQPSFGEDDYVVDFGHVPEDILSRRNQFDVRDRYIDVVPTRDELVTSMVEALQRSSKETTDLKQVVDFLLFRQNSMML